MNLKIQILNKYSSKKGEKETGGTPSTWSGEGRGSAGACEERKTRRWVMHETEEQPGNDRILKHHAEGVRCHIPVLCLLEYGLGHSSRTHNG